MAGISVNIITHNMREQPGKEIVFKKYGQKMAVTKYPDMSKLKPSKLQKEKRNKFVKAVAYAQNILRTPVLEV